MASSDTPTEFGEAITLAAKQAGISIRQVAKELEVNHSHINGMVNGNKSISAKWVKDLTNLFQRHGVIVPDLSPLAWASNNRVPMDNLAEEVKVKISQVIRDPLSMAIFDCNGQRVEYHIDAHGIHLHGTYEPDNKDYTAKMKASRRLYYRHLSDD